MVTITNTHLVIPEFEFVEPRSVLEAASALKALGADARMMAGGTDLLVQLKMERRTPTHIVSLARIDALRAIMSREGLEVGAAATVRQLASSSEVRDGYDALREACHSFSTVQIMLMGTIGGNLCNASPAADLAPALLVLDARVRATSTEDTREIALGGFFEGPGRTVLRPDEVLVSVLVPRPPAQSGSAFLKIGRVAADIAKVSAAVAIVREGDRVRECRIALGSVAATPRRVPQAEAVLTGRALDARVIAEAAEAARGAISPITDVRSTEGYRRHAAGVLVDDTIRLAWERAGGGAPR